MKRRAALKNVALALGGLVSLPAWAENWNERSVSLSSSYFSPKESVLLAEVAETIIPVTDTPGAKELGVHNFIQKIVADCMDKKNQEFFSSGLAAVDTVAQKKFTKPFASCDTGQRISILNEMEASPDKKGFYSMVKGLTIRGYLTSEYVMTNLTHYEMVPGHYYGCVPVSSKK